MRKSLTVLLLVSSAWAQNQVATVTASAPFTLRGVAVTPGLGVATWPVLAGDGLKAGTSPAVVTFPDGSLLTLDPDSEAKIDFVNGKPLFQLTKGKAQYSLKSTLAVQLMAGAKTETPKELTGTLRLGNDKKVAAGATGSRTGLSTPAVIGIIGGAAAAGAIAFGINQEVSGGNPVSP